MRHTIGFFLAVAMSAALFFGGGWGVWRITTVGTASGLQTLHAITDPHNLLPIAAMLGAGLLLGILLAVRRVSPLATGLPGLLLIAWTALAVMRGKYALTFVPLAGGHFAAGFTDMLVTGALAVLGTAMIIPLFIPSRWRGGAADDDDDYVDDDDIDVPSALGLVP